ncbi:MAG: hypothetical protein M3Y59_11155 [Myxococcota bacterium]|nr:hypothetical protein [Myxococcota bacterium]
MMRLLLVSPWLLLSGCALGPGQPFAILHPSFSAALEVPEGRDAGDGWQRLDTSYQVKFTNLELVFAPLQLQEVGASGPITFDPGNPPPGYTVCHNGHCDREDGALVPYAEVQAELNGGAGGPRTVVSLPVGTVDLLSGGERPLECQPSCDLPFTELTRALAPVIRVRMAGLLRDGAVPARIAETSWTLETDLQAAPVTLSGELSLIASNEHPLHAELLVAAPLSGRLWDGIDAATLQPAAGPVDLNIEANADVREALLENLAGLPLHTEVSRR